MLCINTGNGLLNKGSFSKSLLFIGLCFSLTSVAQQAHVKWSLNPFDDKVFIENKGQFDNDVKGGEKVLYQVSFGKIWAYFTPTGLIYRYVEPKKDSKGEAAKKGDPDAGQDQKPVIDYVYENWQHTNPAASIIASEEQTYYNTYATSSSSSIRVNVFKKLTYKNLYPGIDAIYTFPIDSAGIKYTLVVHPGADLSTVKLEYSGAKKIVADANGNIIITTAMGNFTDHAPANCMNGKSIKVAYSLSGTEESFTASGIDNSKDLVIDPWSTNPAFATSPNRAYDVDYDNNGNVYVYGSGGPYQLVKLNAAGTIQWKFTALPIWHPPGFTYYGDFAVDRLTGTSYLVEGCNNTNGSNALKVNTLGTLLAQFPGNPNLTEMWRATYNNCTRQIVIGGGGVFYIYQACILDTNMKKITPVNVLPTATQPYHDIALIGTDPPGQYCYMATAEGVYYDSSFNNQLLRLPLPGLTPPTYEKSDGYHFQETYSMFYVGVPNGSAEANGMNGMAVSSNWVYTYDGFTLKRFAPASGTLTKSNTVTPPVIIVHSGSYYGLAVQPAWGGLDVDYCDNLYAGDVAAINTYDSTLTQTGSIAVADTVYDVVLGQNYTTLYACGVGFVAAITLAPTLNPTIATKHTNSCHCNGTATAKLLLCGDTVTNATYSWSTKPVQTTQTATGLCPGTYTVTISPACDMFFKDSVVIPASTLHPALTGNDTICQGQNTTLFVTGGATYSWSNGATTSSITVAPPKDTLYSVIAADTTGCRDTVNIKVLVNPRPPGAITPPAAICKGNSLQLNAAGGTQYDWQPSAGLSSNTISNPIASPASTTSYTVFISNGICWDTVNTSITVLTPPVIATCCNDTVPAGGSTTLKVIPVTAGNTYSWFPTTGLSCTNCPDPIATPTVTTTYYVVVSDSGNCKSLDSLIEYVNDCANIWLPNAFTPNGDKVNDTFFPKGGACLKTIELYVFDRWGIQIWHSINVPWDGTSGNGTKVVQEDTYIYLIITTDYETNTHRYMGKVTVVK